MNLIKMRPKYASNFPIGRVDVFYNDNTGDFEFCEFNAAGSAAMNEVFHVCKTAQQTNTFKHLENELKKNGKQIKEFELFDSWCNHFEAIYLE